MNCRHQIFKGEVWQKLLAALLTHPYEDEQKASRWRIFTADVVSAAFDVLKPSLYLKTLSDVLGQNDVSWESADSVLHLLNSVAPKIRENIFAKDDDFSLDWELNNEAKPTIEFIKTIF